MEALVQAAQRGLVGCWCPGGVVEVPEQALDDVAGVGDAVRVELGTEAQLGLEEGRQARPVVGGQGREVRRAQEVDVGALQPGATRRLTSSI